MTGKLRDLTVNRDGSQNITVTVAEDFTKAFDTLKDTTITVDIKKAQKGRSRDANAMCWVLCQIIGNSMKPPLPKEEVYRAAIKAVGVFTPVVVIPWDIPTIKRRWESHGVGWFIETVDDAGIGRKLIHLYYGSSTYTVEEMGRLLDWLVDEAEQMGIVIPLSKAQEKELLERWGNR